MFTCITDLELHGDDVYFTLENGAQDADQLQPTAVSNATLLKVFQFIQFHYFMQLL